MNKKSKGYLAKLCRKKIKKAIDHISDDDIFKIAIRLNETFSPKGGVSMNIPDIPELKKAMDLVAFFTANDAEYPVLRDDLKKVLDACQLLCDTSDKLPPKKELGVSTTTTNACHIGYNQAREEDILWLTKKLMGIEEVIRDTGASQGLPLSLSEDLAKALKDKFIIIRRGE